jgi:adenine-specific DNA-methyltransferase
MTNKKQKLELTWIGKDEELKLEPRILIEDPSKSYGDKSAENMLIHGDNLLALKALEQDFAGRIKCIYIDPPYNTGSAFEHYDDSLEHSTWLNLMRPRLDILRNLLAPDGVIAVQIGFDEMAYLKVLMDEIFFRDHCIGQIAVRMSHSAGMKRKAADKRLIKNTEYILVYFKDQTPTLKPIYEITDDYPVNYYQYISEFPTEQKSGKFRPLTDIMFNEFGTLFDQYKIQKSNKSIAFLFKQDEKFRDFIFENKTRIARKDSNVPNISGLDGKSIEEDEIFNYKTENETYWIGRNKDGAYYQIYNLEDKVRKVDFTDDEGVVRQKDAVTNLVGDWWESFWRDMSRVDVEGSVKMKTSKKPERLISWIFQLVTSEGDWILDSFLGSGTTAAVAHKMQRKWLGIELGDHCDTLAKKRLKLVVNGKDKTGISGVYNWKGGGGFKFYNLAPSLLRKDSFGNFVIDEKYNANMLAAAMCKHEGFKFYPDETLYWKHGKSTETDFIFVTTGFITAEQLDKVHSEMKAGESLLICAKAYAPECENHFANITIKKIPQMILGRCEFGKDNYDLNIIKATEAEAEESNEE